MSDPESENDANAETTLEFEETKKFAGSDMDLPGFLIRPRGVLLPNGMLALAPISPDSECARIATGTRVANSFIVSMSRSHESCAGMSSRRACSSIISCRTCLCSSSNERTAWLASSRLLTLRNDGGWSIDLRLTCAQGGCLRDRKGGGSLGTKFETSFLSVH